LHLLAKENIKATFFIIGKKADQYPELIKKILDNGHSVGNHSWSHDNFLMFRTPKILACDLRKTQTVLARFRVHPLAFRPPVGITGPRLWPVLERLNMFAVNFSCRAYDRGNRNVKKLAGSILKRVRPGDILLLHDARPLQGGQEELWKKELSHLFSELKTHYRIVPLETLIGRPVMEYIDPKESAQE
jgi:peptidoglycan/xylan/chitin deacetylase (PgdA/CDA1 family)